MKKLATILIACALAVPIDLMADTKKSSLTIEGGIRCDFWTVARNARNDDLLEHYLLGLLDGLSVGQGREFWEIIGYQRLNREAAYLWMDDYCRTNPSAFFMNGVLKLFQERSVAGHR